MDSATFNEYYRDIYSALEKQCLNQALKNLENLLYTNPTWPFLDEVIHIRQAYDGLLKYMELGLKDESRKSQFQILLQRAYKLLHQLKRHFLKESQHTLFHKTWLTVRRQSYQDWMIQLEQAQVSEMMYKQDNEAFKKELENHERNVNNLFDQIWTSSLFSETDILELRALLNSTLITKDDKLLCISALTLQQSFCPDSNVLSILLELSLSNEAEMEIKIRAIIGWLLCLMKYEKEYLLSEQCKKLIIQNFQINSTQQLICNALNDFYLSLESKELINKVQNEILPLLNNENLLTGDKKDMDRILQSSMKKIEKLVNSGADIQFSSFFQDKNYPFFKQTSNWFRPFSEHHSETELSMREKKMENLKVLLKNPGLCDNDKWSLFFKTKGINIPLNIQGLSPEDIENLDITITPEIYSRNYIHDLFRFFNLYPYRLEFVNLLKQDFSPVVHTFLQKLLYDEYLFLLARVLFSNKVFSDSILIAKKFLSDEKYSLQAYKLIADSYRLNNDFEHAIEYYQKAYSLKQEDGTLHMLAQCYKQIQKFKEAAEIYRNLYENKPEDKAICKLYASSLIKSDNTKEAIPLLYKIMYIDEKESDFIQGSLAWCYLLEGKLEEAWAAHEKIKNKTLSDMLNGGHICWAMNDFKNAIQFYKYFYSKSPDKAKAKDNMESDLKYMKKYGLKKFELRLILEICEN